MAKAIRVSKDGDNKLVKPSEGYDQEMDVDLDEWDKLGPLGGSLPPSPVEFPLGAPVSDICVVDGDVYTKKK